MPTTIDLASNETVIKRCCAVLRQLRPHLEEGAMTVPKDSASFCLIGLSQPPKNRVARSSHWILGFNGLVPIDFTLPVGWTLSLITSVCAFNRNSGEVEEGLDYDGA
jgi:hypothetical protein